MQIALVFNLKTGDINAYSRLSKVRQHKVLNPATIRNYMSLYKTDTYFKGDFKVVRVELR